MTPLIALACLLFAAALAQEPRTVTYEFPDVEPVEGVLRPTASYVFPASIADARPPPPSLERLAGRRRALERRRESPATTVALGDLDRHEAQLRERELWASWDHALASGDEPPDDAEEQTAIDSLRREAITRYDLALASSQAPEPDRVLLARGITARLLLDRTEARGSLTALVEEHPDSRHVASAHLLLGELAYEVGEPADATEHYTAVADTEHELAPYASYMLAWCQLMWGQESEGLRRLRALAAGPDDEPLSDMARDDLERLGEGRR